MSKQRATRATMLAAALKDPEFRALWEGARVARQAGELVASIREEQGLTQAVLGSKAGTSRQYIAILEDGLVNASFDMLEKVLNAMDYTLVLKAEKRTAGGES